MLATVTTWRERNDRVWLTRVKTDLEIELRAQTPDTFLLQEEQIVNSRQDPKVQEMQY